MGAYYVNILREWLRESKRDHARLVAQIERMGNRDPVKRAQIVRLMNLKLSIIRTIEDAITQAGMHGDNSPRYTQTGQLK